MTHRDIPGTKPGRGVAGKVVLIGLVLIGVVGGAGWLGSLIGERLGSGDGAAVTAPDVEPGLDVEIVIPDGASARTIAGILVEAGVVSSSARFEAAVRSGGFEAGLRAGTYELVTGMDVDDVIDVLRRGPIVVTYTITIPEGLRVTEMLGVIAEASGFDRAALESALTSGEVTTSLRQLPTNPTLTDWEGLLFPDTYTFSQNATPAGILDRLATTMEQRVASIDWSVLEARGFTTYEGIIMASLVEAEVKVARERPTVASVLYNRLADGQKLDIDATVLYGLGTRDPSDFDSSVDTPYNTYRNVGLPPTPIAAPGRAALEAVAAPADTEFRYYVLSGEDGSHTFAVTYAEHLANVAASRAAGILP